MDYSSKLGLILTTFCGSATFLYILESNLKYKTIFHWSLLRRKYMLAHALLSLVLSFACWVETDSLIHNNTWREDFLMCVYLGHYLFDMLFVMCLIPCYSMALNHSLIFLWLSGGIFFGKGGMASLLAITVGGCSDVLLHARDLITLVNQKYTGLYYAVEFLFFIAYAVPRLTIAPVMFAYVFLFKGHYECLEAIGLLGLIIQSYYNVYNMLPVIKSRVKEFLSKKVDRWMNPI